MKKLFTTTIIAGAVTASATVLAGPPLTTYTWIGPDGTWNLDTNWSPLGVPDGPDDAAVINSGVNVTVDLIADVDALTVGLNDAVLIDNGRRLRIRGGAPGIGILDNAGLITVGSTGSSTYLQAADGEVQLTGGGTIVLTDTPTTWMYRSSAGGSFMVVDQTIRGAGNLGWSGAPTDFANAGTIIADGTNPLIFTTPNGTNSGALRAESGAELRILSTTLDNTGARSPPTMRRRSRCSPARSPAACSRPSAAGS